MALLAAEGVGHLRARWPSIRPSWAPPRSARAAPRAARATRELPPPALNSLPRRPEMPWWRASAWICCRQLARSSTKLLAHRGHGAPLIPVGHPDPRLRQPTPAASAGSARSVLARRFGPRRALASSDRRGAAWRPAKGESAAQRNSRPMQASTATFATALRERSPTARFVHGAFRVALPSVVGSHYLPPPQHRI
jgi:hypothetical protein